MFVCGAVVGAGVRFVRSLTSSSLDVRVIAITVVMVLSWWLSVLCVMSGGLLYVCLMPERVVCFIMLHVSVLRVVFSLMVCIRVLLLRLRLLFVLVLI